MNDKPILFNNDMVTAIYIDKTKNQTRRIIKDPWGVMPPKVGEEKKPYKFKLYKDSKSNGEAIEIKPAYQIGQKVWIKQSFNITTILRSKHYIAGYREDESEFSVYLNDDEWPKFIKWKKPFQKKSKLFMFKSLAYRWIKITGVRVERLQDISEDDAKNEGLKKTQVTRYNDLYEVGKFYSNNSIDCFKQLWDSINEKRGFPWSSNPWVFIYDFEAVI